MMCDKAPILEMKEDIISPTGVQIEPSANLPSRAKNSTSTASKKIIPMSKEKRYNDLKTAYEIANSNNEQLRVRLKKSTEGMKSQSEFMKKMRQTVQNALEDRRLLKDTLVVEKESKSTLQQELEREKASRHSLEKRCELLNKNNEGYEEYIQKEKEKRESSRGVECQTEIDPQLEELQSKIADNDIAFRSQIASLEEEAAVASNTLKTTREMYEQSVKDWKASESKNSINVSKIQHLETLLKTAKNDVDIKSGMVKDMQSDAKQLRLQVSQFSKENAEMKSTITGLEKEIKFLVSSAQSNDQKYIASAESLERELDLLKLENREMKTKLDIQESMPSCSTQTDEDEYLSEYAKRAIYDRECMAQTYYDDCCRLNWICRNHQSHIDCLRHELQSLREQMSPDAASTPNSNKYNPQASWNNLNKSFTPKLSATINNSLNTIKESDECVSPTKPNTNEFTYSNSPSNDTAVQNSSPANLFAHECGPASPQSHEALDVDGEGIIEAHVPSPVSRIEMSPAHSEKNPSLVMDEHKTGQSQISVEPVTPLSTSVKSEKISQSTAAKSTAVYSVSHASTGRKSSRKHRSSRKKKSLNGSTCTTGSSRSKADSLALLPIWRRENPNNIHADVNEDDSSYPVMEESQNHDVINSENLSFEVNDLPLRPLASTGFPDNNVQRIGIPMSQKKFDQMIAEGRGNGSSNPEDDGYASSSNSILNEELQLLKKYQRKNGRLQYPVSYNGVTFDLLSFTMVTMQQVVAQCGACESPEAMCHFFDFIAKKADKLNNDALLRSKHHLGKGSDWLDLKKSYCY